MTESLCKQCINYNGYVCKIYRCVVDEIITSCIHFVAQSNLDNFNTVRGKAS